MLNTREVLRPEEKSSTLGKDMPEVSDLFIKLNYWFLSNRRDLRRWWVIVLIGLDLFLIVYVVTMGITSLTSIRETSNFIDAIGTSRVISAETTKRVTPEAFTIGTVERVEDGSGNTIVVAPITNPNTLWSAKTVSYVFEGLIETSDQRTTILTPGASSVLLSTTDPGPDAKVRIVSIDWVRSTQGALPNVKVSFSEGVHKTVIVPSAGGVKAISQIDTELTNLSLYAIKEIKGIVVARDGSKIVGVKQFFVDSLTPRETRSVTIQFAGTLAQLNAIDFYAEINVFDPDQLSL